MSDARYRRNAGTVLYQKEQELEVTIEALEIMPDHVHLFIESNPTEAPHRLANQLKRYIEMQKSS